MGIQKKLGLVICSILLVSFIALFLFINRGVSKNNDSLVSSILIKQEEGNNQSISVLNNGFGEIANELKQAEQTTRKIISDLYFTFYGSLSHAVMNQIFPLVVGFDYDSANDVINDLLKNSPDISWVGYVASESPSENDIYEFGHKESGKEVKIFSHEMKDDFGFLKLEIQVKLSGMKSLVKTREIFQKINTDNQKLLSAINKISQKAIIDGHEYAVSVANQSKKMIQHRIWMLLAITLILVNLVLFFVTRTITRPILKAVEHARQIANGDLTHTLDIDQSDEIGILVKALNQMSLNLNQMFTELTQGVEGLSSSSIQLSAISSQMLTGADQTSGKSDSVAAAAEKMSAGMNSVAAASEQASTNVQMVTTAAEEMSSTINEIARSTEKGRSVTNDAVIKSEKVLKKVDQLGFAAEQIGTVTESIAEISEQTNLLALNATIEAARAGEAGKGFAVVAGEIKDLAKQTSAATRKIRESIEGIQNTTDVAVNEIEEITTVISNVNEIVTTISAAVEEQSAATQEIANNVNQAAVGIQDVNRNVAESSMISEGIAREIVEVSQSSKEMSDASSQVNISAKEMSSLAEQIHGMTSRFKIN